MDLSEPQPAKLLFKGQIFWQFSGKIIATGCYF